MTFITQPQKEGETKKCPECDLELVGRLTDYKGRYPDKLQWQNKDSRKAHYDKNGNCEVTETTSTQQEITPSSSNKSESNIEPKKNHPDFLENSKKDPIKRKALLLWHIRAYIELTIKELEVNPNGGMIWEMTKIIYDDLYGDPKN